MADRRPHRRMTSEEQARLSQSRHAQSDRPATLRRSSSTPLQQAPRRVEPGAGYVAGGTPTHAASRYEGAGAYTARRKKQGARRALKGLLVALVVVLVGVGVAAGAYVLDINNRLTEGITDNLREVLEPVKMDEPFYMLLLGVDKSEGRADEWGSSDSNFRSDTIILARVDPPGQKITLVSIPRDTQVDMGENGKRKINDAYSLGGPSYAVEVVEDFAGVNISHYAEIDFEQFTSIVDTIGGIEVTLPVAVKDLTYANIDLPAGTQALNGEQALGLVRSRHAYDEYGGGDFYRAANQRMVIGAIVKKVLKLDPVSMTSTVSELASSVTTDFNVADILSLATQFKDFDVTTSMYSGQTPTESQYVNGVWWEMPIESQWEEMMDRVEQGLSPYSDESQDFTAGVAGSIGVSVSDDGGTSSEGEGGGETSASEQATYSGDVLVLNGTSTAGLAARKASTLKDKGFNTATDNASSSNNSASAVYYSGEARSAALGVAETLGISTSHVAQNDGSYSSDFDVIVILGSDQVD